MVILRVPFFGVGDQKETTYFVRSCSDSCPFVWSSPTRAIAPSYGQPLPNNGGRTAWFFQNPTKAPNFYRWISREQLGGSPTLRPPPSHFENSLTATLRDTFCLMCLSPEIAIRFWLHPVVAMFLARLRLRRWTERSWWCQAGKEGQGLLARCYSLGHSYSTASDSLGFLPFKF